MSVVHAYYTRDYVYDPSVYDDTTGKYGSSIEGFNIKNLNPLTPLKAAWTWVKKWVKYVLSAICAVCILSIVATVVLKP